MVGQGRGRGSHLFGDLHTEGQQVVGVEEAGEHGLQAEGRGGGGGGWPTCLGICTQRESRWSVSRKKASTACRLMVGQGRGRVAHLFRNLHAEGQQVVGVEEAAEHGLQAVEELLLARQLLHHVQPHLDRLRP